MVFPILMAAKAGLIPAAAATHQCALTPLLTALLWPFVLKLTFNLPPLQESFIDMTHSFRLFAFQMGQIITLDGDPAGTTTRWQRAFRLVCQRLNHVRPTASDQESLVALSMIALRFLPLSEAARKFSRHETWVRAAAHRSIARQELDSFSGISYY